MIITSGFQLSLDTSSFYQYNADTETPKKKQINYTRSNDETESERSSVNR